MTGASADVDVIIEDPKGATTRHVWDRRSESWREFAHPQARSPWPADYGFVPGTANPADGDEVDAIVVASITFHSGDRIGARIVGVLIRPDGDHKLLVVPKEDPIYGCAESWTEIDAPILERIERWFREWTSFGGWGSPADGVRLLSETRVRHVEPEQ